ncbi:hypothetical protein [Streptomyces tauricus]|uniref:hypothetical protein n=1 Tax=Streptomyces tauricus TaxID=68274 RepID=UPI00381C5EE7
MLDTLLRDIDAANINAFARTVTTPADYELTSTVMPERCLNSVKFHIESSKRRVNTANLRAYDTQTAVARRQAEKIITEGMLPPLAQKLLIGERRLQGRGLRQCQPLRHPARCPGFERGRGSPRPLQPPADHRLRRPDLGRRRVPARHPGGPLDPAPAELRVAETQYGVTAESLVLSSGSNPAIPREDAPGIVIT